MRLIVALFKIIGVIAKLISFVDYLILPAKVDALRF